MEVIDPSTMTEDDVLLYTRAQRMALANELTKDGVPTDKDNAGILLHALDGLDKASLTKLRILADEKANKQSANNAALIAEVLSKVGNSAYQMSGVSRNDTSLPDDIPNPEIVEGELETNPTQVDYDTFMKQFDDQ